MPGRRPKPVALKILAGNPGHRTSFPAHPGETFRAGRPDKPTWLGPDASAEWDRLVELLCDQSGVLSPAHGGILLVACEHYSAFMRANQFIEKNGETYKTEGESGALIREYPAVRQRHEALKGYRQALLDLGAAPTQATRVNRLPSEQTELPLQGISRFLT